MLACACLNIIIEPETNDLLKVAKDTLDLTEFEKKDSFFNQDIQQTSKLNKFLKKIPALVTTRLVGSRWIIYECINCNVNTHAICRDNGAALILISSKLVDNDGVLEIKRSNQYSPIFDIKILESYTPAYGKASEIASSDSEAIISSLRQRVNEFINKETVAVENRIRKFTEDQYKALDEYRDRVFKEHHVLKMKILEHKLDTSADNELSTNLSHNKPKSSNRTVPDAISNNTKSPLVSKAKPIVNNKSPSKKRNSDLSYSRSMSAYANSYDAEVFFPLEDMQDEPTLEQSDFEDSDQEDLPKDDSSDPIQRQKQSSQLAKSLPVNIPVFMSAYQNHLSEDNDDDLPDESMDIAASIKALAKSIQGSTVFGELPRSRFSSQI